MLHLLIAQFDGNRRRRKPYVRRRRKVDGWAQFNHLQPINAFMTPCEHQGTYFDLRLLAASVLGDLGHVTMQVMDGPRDIPFVTSKTPAAPLLDKSCGGESISLRNKQIILT